RHQRDHQRVAAARHGDAVRHPGECREPLFEKVDLRPENELAVAKDGVHALAKIGFEPRPLTLQIEERDAPSACHREGCRPACCHEVASPLKEGLTVRCPMADRIISASWTASRPARPSTAVAAPVSMLVRKAVISAARLSAEASGIASFSIGPPSAWLVT